MPAGIHGSVYGTWRTLTIFARLASIQPIANANCKVVCVFMVHRDDQCMDVTVTYDWINLTVEGILPVIWLMMSPTAVSNCYCIMLSQTSVDEVCTGLYY